MCDGAEPHRGGVAAAAAAGGGAASMTSGDEGGMKKARGGIDHDCLLMVRRGMM